MGTRVCGFALSTSVTFGSVKASAVLLTEKDPQTRAQRVELMGDCSLCRAISHPVPAPRLTPRARRPSRDQVSVEAGPRINPALWVHTSCVSGWLMGLRGV